MPGISEVFDSVIAIMISSKYDKNMPCLVYICFPVVEKSTNTVLQCQFTKVNLNWPSAAAGKAECVRSASACHIGGPIGINPAHLSKGTSGLKQKCTQLLTSLLGTVFHALSLNIHFFPAEI